MNALHKEVLKRLGFDVLHEKAYTVHSKNYDGVLVEHYIREAWVLARNGQSLMDLNPFKPTTEADAWAQAPTLEDLMLPLLDAIRQVFEVSITPRKDDFRGSISETPYLYYGAQETSLPLTVADLFNAGCRLGRIDASKVVL